MKFFRFVKQKQVMTKTQPFNYGNLSLRDKITFKNFIFVILY